MSCNLDNLDSCPPDGVASPGPAFGADVLATAQRDTAPRAVNFSGGRFAGILAPPVASALRAESAAGRGAQLFARDPNAGDGAGGRGGSLLPFIAFALALAALANA